MPVPRLPVKLSTLTVLPIEMIKYIFFPSITDRCCSWVTENKPQVHPNPSNKPQLWLTMIHLHFYYFTKRRNRTCLAFFTPTKNFGFEVWDVFHDELNQKSIWKIYIYIKKRFGLFARKTSIDKFVFDSMLLESLTKLAC